MKMTQNVTPALKKMERELEQAKINKNLLKIASQVRNDIHTRTVKKGRDYRERKFKGYSYLTAIARKKAKKPIDRVTLSWTGAMLGSMTIKKIAKGAAIYFNDETERKKAEKHHYGEGLPRRSFFKLSKDNERYIYDRFEKPIIKAMR